MLYSNLPCLDLHGEDRESARILVNEFVRDNYKLGNFRVVIVHGLGTGIVKKSVHNTLKSNRLVTDYKIDNFNIGCTIVDICKNIDK